MIFIVLSSTAQGHMQVHFGSSEWNSLIKQILSFCFSD